MSLQDVPDQSGKSHAVESILKYFQKKSCATLYMISDTAVTFLAPDLHQFLLPAATHRVGACTALNIPCREDLARIKDFKYIKTGYISFRHLFCTCPIITAPALGFLRLIDLAVRHTIRGCRITCGHAIAILVGEYDVVGMV